MICQVRFIVKERETTDGIADVGTFDKCLEDQQPLLLDALSRPLNVTILFTEKRWSLSLENDPIGTRLAVESLC